MNKDWRYIAGILAMCLASGSGVAHADDSAFKAGADGLEYKGDNVEIVLGGRLHLDAATIDTGASSTDDTEVRRARLELSMKFFDDWQLRVDREFANGGGWRNVWLRYDINDDLNVKLGNFIAPFSMEDVASSNESMFMERSLVQALAPGFGLGVGASYGGKHFTLAGAYLEDALDAEDNIQAEKGRGLTLRATWSPIEERSQVLHLGAGLERRDFSTGDVRSFSSSPEASLAPTVIRSGTIANVDTQNGYNVEAAYSVGPVLMQAQYVKTDVQRTVGTDLSFDGYYAQIGWVVTGERHRYAEGVGVFTGPNPKGKWGAVELAARVSSLDLSESASGGTADDVTAGVNWYIGKNVRLMANYVHSEVDGVTPLLDRETDVGEARLQVNF